MKNKYLAYDGINGEYESFDSIELAEKWLEEAFMDGGEIHPDWESCKIYELKLIYSDIPYDSPEREKKRDFFMERVKDCADRLPYLIKVFRSKETDVLREKGTIALKFKRVESNQLEVNNEEEKDSR